MIEQDAPGLNPDFAEELQRALRLIAESEHLRGKHTNFNGEIVSMGRIVATAANVLGRPLAGRAALEQS